MAASLTPEARRRLVRPLATSAAVGVVVYVLTAYFGLPMVERRLTDAQVDWLRQVLADHPFAVLASIMGIAAVLGLPVVAAFLWTYRRTPRA